MGCREPPNRFTLKGPTENNSRDLQKIIRRKILVFIIKGVVLSSWLHYFIILTFRSLFLKIAWTQYPFFKIKVAL